jgi:hypothetical protein
MSTASAMLAPPTPARLTVRSIGLGVVDVPVLATADLEGLTLAVRGTECRRLRWIELRSYSIAEHDHASLTVQLGPYREELTLETDSRQVLLAWAQALDAHDLRRVHVRYGFD